MDVMNMSPMFCSQVFTFTVDNSTNSSIDLTKDLNALVCNFESLSQPTITMSDNPFVLWGNVLEVSEMSDNVLNAFKNNSLNFTMNPSVATFQCVGTPDLTVSFADSECGFVTCPFDISMPTGPLDILISQINQLVPTLSSYFNIIFNGLNIGFNA